MKIKHYLSMLIMSFVAVAGLSVVELDANSPAAVYNRSDCALNISFVTDQLTLFGPQLVGPGGSYEIKVPTGESIAKVVVNTVGNDPNITIGTCEPLEYRPPALCLSTTEPSRFCRRDTQVWVIY